ncbi:putative O-methyltransferase domain, S-adenosyl-L-methionine-dependent methyltransferase [Septoria linicola]|nr:putative O-methyltransferase domain, S-adenosyl-L-methionine-dependent methyltransferase [Septoria linicola]
MSQEQPPPPTTSDHHDPKSHISLLNSLSSSSFPSEADRLSALSAARSLVRRLEQPWERMYDIAWVQPAFLASFRTAQLLNIFAHLTSTPQSSRELGQKVSADPALLRRLMRVLVKEGVVGEGPRHASSTSSSIQASAQISNESDDDTYISTPFTQALTSPTGIITGLDIYYLAGIPQHSHLPSHLATHNYQNPTDGDHPPWKWNAGIPDYEGDRWEWYNEPEQKELSEKFNAFLSAVRKDSPPWTDLYPKQRMTSLLESWDESTPLLVDVGGGRGRDISNFAAFLSSLAPSTTTSSTSSKPYSTDPLLLLLERPTLLSTLTLPSNITPLPHNFFHPTPPSAQAAKIYFLHAVLHDWSSSLASQILTRIREAMKPSYSRLIIFDRVVPERAGDWDVKTAALDINMMCNFAALERTEGQWKALIEGAGLRYLGCVRVAGQSDFLEAEL